MIKYFIVKKWTKVNNEFYSKDVVINDLVALGDYLNENPNLYKLDLRIVREKSSDLEVTCVK